jgi:short-subunit dehydrogenase
MSRSDSWERAVVTGASAGIGEAFARELAARGCDLVLVARRGQRLEKLASELAAAGGIEAEPLPADLTDAEGLAAVEARLEHRDWPVDLLVNNAGGASRFAPFLELDRKTLADDAFLNSLALLRLTHAAARGMAERDGGSVINVSAGVGFYPLPGAAAYGASKAFVNSLSEALEFELRDAGVRVTAVCPGFTRTGAQKRLGMNVASVPRALWMDPGEVAIRSLRAAEHGRAISSLNAVGRFNEFFGRHLPRHILLPRVAKAQLRLLGR